MKKRKQNKKAPARDVARQADEEARILASLEGTLEPRHARRHVGHFVVGLFRWLVYAALGALCIGIFYIAVILGETPELVAAQQENKSLIEIAALPELPLGGLESTDLAQLSQAFPGPLASLPADQGFTIVRGVAEDVRIPGAQKPCRVVAITYEHPGLTSQVALVSATPTDYLKRFEQAGFSLEPLQVALSTMPATAMRLPDRQVWVANQGGCVYSLEAPLEMESISSVAPWVTLRTDGE